MPKALKINFQMRLKKSEVSGLQEDIITGEPDHYYRRQSMNTADVFIRVEKEGQMPSYQSVNAAGCDLYATCDMALRPGETKVMPLNFVIAMGKEMEAQVRPRSGLSLKTDLRVPNSPGTIDSDYRNIVGVIIENTYNVSNLPCQIAQNPEIMLTLVKEYKELSLLEYLTSKGVNSKYTSQKLSILDERIYVDKLGNPYGTIYIKKGERIAQMVFAEYKRANFIPHPKPEDIGEDRGGGFGHTGISK
jgi:dUTP pyrophosphatase